VVMKSQKRFILALLLILLMRSGWQAQARSLHSLGNGLDDVPQKHLLDESQRVISGPQAADMITQYGITWTFDQTYETGQFANGDYWVVGPVTITAITPDFDGSVNGWEVNPVYAGDQGFDSFCGNFDASLVPDLPYVALPGQSIVKSVASDHSTRNCLQTATVLTVVAAIPPGGGATVFRPPYVGTDKPYYYVSDLRTELLPAYPPVEDTPTLAWVESSFGRVQLDHKGGAVGRYLHPIDNIPDYGGDIGRRNGDGALRLMLNDPISARMPALIAYVQYGIDLYHMMLDGHTWPDGGGHRPGQKLPLTFAATLLDHPGMKAAIQDATFFHEDKVMWYSPVAAHTLYGSDQGYDFDLLEQRYWEVIVSDLNGQVSGYKSYRDPYGYIDGGYMPAGGYQFCCTSQPWKGSALALHLLPQMKLVWYTTAIYDYADRWVSFGAWTQPDPCAPAEANWDNYGVTFGPDGNGGCIPDTDPSDGIGRFPQQHGQAPDGGYRYSNFQAAMWDAYRHEGLLSLSAIPRDQTVFLNWQVNVSLPLTSTWQIEYYTTTLNILTATDPFSTTRTYTLTNLTNYQWYTITLTTDPLSLTDTLRIMPTGILIYLPLGLK
jgi:hypothetical protein